MRRVIWAAVAAVMLSACGDKENGWPAGGVEYKFDAVPNTNGATTADWEWVYVRLSDGKTWGGNDAKGFELGADWDIAVLTYRAEVAVRTNSGTSGSGQGGVAGYGTTLVDKKQTLKYMKIGQGRPSIAETEDVSWSGQFAVNFSLDKMPPEYTKAAAFVVRSGDGKHTYTVEFTGYQNDAGEAGHITLLVRSVE